jgi:hypothetical protein
MSDPCHLGGPGGIPGPDGRIASTRHRPAALRGHRSIGTGRFPRPCGVCGSPSAQTVLIAATGVSFLKDLCESHLRGLLDGAHG